MPSPNTGGSQTQLLGSADAASNSKKIVLFNQSLLSDKISLYGMKNYYSSVVLAGKYLALVRTASDTFEYNFKNGIIEGFDLIIYLQADNTPIGFTEFNNVQGLSRNISIKISITSASSGSDTGVIDNCNLSQLKVTDLSLILLGDEDFKYASGKKVLENLPTPNTSFTTHVDDLKRNKAIITSTGGILGDEVYRCSILKDKNYDPHEIGFTDYSFCKNGTDTVVLEWVGNKYSIYSMTLANFFGNPRAYTRDNLDISTKGKVTPIGSASGEDIHTKSAGYCEIPLFSESTVNQKIISCSGRYILVDVDGDSKIYDAVTDKFIISDQELVIDERAPKSKLIRLGAGWDNFVLGCPELLNLFIDISQLFVKNLKIYRQIGSWFILQYSYSTSSDLYLCAGPTLSIYLTREDLDRLIILNDNVILLKEDNYYVMYYGYMKSYYSERARNITESGSLEYLNVVVNKDLVLPILFNYNGSYDDLYKAYYEEKDILLIGKEEELFTTVFNKYRRNSYPLDIKGIPDIIGGCEGLLFYKHGKTINYL